MELRVDVGIIDSVRAFFVLGNVICGASSPSVLLSDAIIRPLVTIEASEAAESSISSVASDTKLVRRALLWVAHSFWRGRPCSILGVRLMVISLASSTEKEKIEERKECVEMSAKLSENRGKKALKCQQN
jgi:hypothetical protein